MVARSNRDVSGKAPDYVASPGACDQKHMDRIGKLKNCIANGPEIPGLTHKPEEYVGNRDMIDSARVMEYTLVQLLLPKGPSSKA